MRNFLLLLLCLVIIWFAFQENSKMAINQLIRTIIKAL